MSVETIQARLDSYTLKSDLEQRQAIREITQEVVLASLGRAGFFKEAAFQGGTCLRIFHNLQRFSEDLDFIVQRTDMAFSLTPYLKSVREELSAYGYNFEIADRSTAATAVKKAFLKDDSLGKVLRLGFMDRSGPQRKIRIKIEVDTNPPAGSDFALEYLDFPFVAAVTVQDLPSLFAGKLHALLCRRYTKGRDWYDFIWYTSRRTPVNLAFLSAALDQMGPWQDRGLTVDVAWCRRELARRIEAIDWPSVTRDVRPFVKQAELPSLDLWSKDLFLKQLEKLQ